MEDAVSDLPPRAEEDAYAHVGRSLRKLRLERGLTQAQAARVISVSPQQYQKYEDAHSKCSLNYLIALADHYGVSVNAFLPDCADHGTAPAAPQPEIANEADLLARLVTAFVGLDDAEEKLRFVQLIEAVGSAHGRGGE
ncbi:helix-turn-helix transcriptional regulator [Cognatiyoonia sp. IB215446]|uniref:helix-turn-helix domain-containing protein n=1 Tax=Cognatiyoonia sp. IB215446 TaxID=3097355 RepID=UPI002A14311B|nr:helix-turn-helix transcriptional regulator [Cognatiyoonia sp. IB215446]MDX8346857.1 helix-turn-helix transcriptional regulator [Cognatiyoonia sp. IB215446]